MRESVRRKKGNKVRCCLSLTLLVEKLPGDITTLEAIGLEVGFLEGDGVGFLLGLDVGFLEGASVVGAFVGSLLGLAVGLAVVGLAVGLAVVGLTVGFILGLPVGFMLGLEVGDSVGAGVGCGVMLQPPDALSSLSDVFNLQTYAILPVM